MQALDILINHYVANVPVKSIVVESLFFTADATLNDDIVLKRKEASKISEKEQNNELHQTETEQIDCTTLTHCKENEKLQSMQEEKNSVHQRGFLLNVLTL